MRNKRKAIKHKRVGKETIDEHKKTEGSKDSLINFLEFVGLIKIKRYEIIYRER